MTAVLGSLLLLGGVLAFVSLVRTGSPRLIVLTPFLVFGINEGIRVWPAVFYAELAGFTADGYPILVAGIALCFFVLGYVSFMGLAGERLRLPRRFQSTPLSTPRRSGRHYAVGLALTAGLLLFGGVVLYRGSPPLGQAIQSIVAGTEEHADVTEFMGEQRKTITKGHIFGGEYRGQGLLRSVMSVGWSYILGLSILLALYYRTRAWFVLSVVVGLLAFVFVAGDGTRGPLGAVIVYAAILYSLYAGMRVRTAATGLIVIVAAVLVMSWLTPKGGHVFADSDDLAMGAVSAVGRRIALGNGMNNIHAMEFLRKGRISHRGGTEHVRKFAAIIPGVGPGPPFAHELHLLLNPRSQGTTNQTMTYQGLVYVDFGLLGVALIYLLMGAVVGIAQYRLLQARKDLESLPLLAYLVFMVGWLPIGGFSSFVASGAVLLCVHALTHFSLMVATFLLNSPGTAHAPKPWHSRAPQ